MPLNLENTEVEGVILAASTCDIGAESNVKLSVIGSTNITSFGSEANYFRILRLYGTPTITHNGTTMNMPGATNYTPSAGQVVYVASDGDGNAYLTEDTSSGATVDAASVDAAGAVMNSDTSTAAMSFVVDEDNMSSDSATKVPTQQSVKAYVDASASSWTYATPQATTSGTAFDFTGIPSGTDEIEIVLEACSLDGTDNFLIQLGDSGGIETTGYTATCCEVSTGVTNINSTSGFPIYGNNASLTYNAVIRLVKYDSTGVDWGVILGGNRSTSTLSGAGIKTLSAELTQVRLTRDGTNNYDAGLVSLRYK